MLVKDTITEITYWTMIQCVELLEEELQHYYRYGKGNPPSARNSPARTTAPFAANPTPKRFNTPASPANAAFTARRPKTIAPPAPAAIADFSSQLVSSINLAIHPF